MINPLDALSALTQFQAPTAGVNALPTGTTGAMGAPNAVTENFQLLQPTQASQLTVPDISVNSVNSAGGPSTWGHMMQQMVLNVNSQQQTAAQKVSDVLQGGPTPIHEAMVATEEASLSFEFLGEMRNKIVDAYQQVMQMQV